MGFKVKLNMDTAKLKKILRDKQDLLEHNIQTVVRVDAIPHLIDLIMKGYDELSEMMATLPEDPTNPSNWRGEFQARLHIDLERNLLVTANGLIIRLGDKEYLGYAEGGQSDSTDDSPLVWMVYYIEGLVGDWAYISPSTYELMRDRAPDPSWGRFGEGFMISKEQFDAEGWDDVVSFEEVRHPFSGFSPLDIFTEALNEFQMKPFIAKAIKVSKEGRRL